ncbi:uncharacterized protein N7484_005955 [Penicillium longicatenatum]|uniref:uncharacterized protein n=1 Tax=Penicillium longicatenatum TaxID=1561947 RepID=UPI002546C2E2|nr:uncharacterized protein N7484_005955 [Penicillium longicatenatum]KAJ5643448.1 hypothetical protein N7484_005955 [Penicillium longicatenatum]
MRILCCHGFGTGPEVMKHQLAKLQKYCDPSWQFYFVAGQFEGPPDPGVAAAFPGPYLCYSLDFDTAGMRAAHGLLDQEFEKHGPFDGVLGFSTGAALLAAYLLEKMALYPEKPLPVQFAIFCSTIPPLSADSAYTEMVLGSLSPEEQQRIRSSDDIQISQLPEPIRSSISLTARCFDLLKAVHGRPLSDFLDRSMIDVPCILRPDVYNARLAIPTFHCWGKNDPPVFQESAMLVESFCHPRLCISYQHSVIHNLPRSAVEVKEMVSGIEKMISLNQQPRL